MKRALIVCCDGVPVDTYPATIGGYCDARDTARRLVLEGPGLRASVVDRTVVGEKVFEHTWSVERTCPCTYRVAGIGGFTLCDRMTQDELHAGAERLGL